jgi:hypothetical protein
VHAIATIHLRIVVCYPRRMSGLDHLEEMDDARLKAVLAHGDRSSGREALIRAADPAAVPYFLLRWHGSEKRPLAFLDIVAAMPECEGAEFWRLVAACWPGFDLIPHREFAVAFRRHRSAWTPDAMTGEDRAAFDALPPHLTIYRGQDAGAPLGLSWTLSHDVAEGFARGHRGIRHRSPAICTARVRRSSVAFMCTDRDEAEVVLFRAPRNVAVQATGATTAAE